MPKLKTSGNLAIKRIWFAGAPNAGAKEPYSLKLGGPTPRSRMLPLSHPDFGGCRWPIDTDCAEQLFCCAPAAGRFCPAHNREGVRPVPPEGKGSVAELLRMAEKIR